VIFSFVHATPFLTISWIIVLLSAADGGGSASGVARILTEIKESITSWIATYGYPAVFAAALFETIFPPIPSEVIFPLAGYTAYIKALGIGHAIGMAASGALGSTVGAIIIYFISFKMGKKAIIKFGKRLRISESSIEKAESWFERHGELAVFLGRMAPGVRELISIPAGIGRMNLSKFIIFTFLGSLVWSIALTLMGYFAGQAWEQYSEQISSVFSLVAIIIVVGLVIVFGIRYYNNSQKKGNWVK
jgi:membrane protein DedA with SNARE-associated domain